MNVAEDRRPEFASDVPDLREIPLAEVHADGAVDDTLRRILAQPSVPVAAFNSSI